MKKKIFFYLKYGSLSASTRLRFLSFFSYLKNYYQIYDYVLFDNEYFKNKIVNNKINILKIFLTYFKRACQVFLQEKNSLIVIQGELLPYIPAFFEKILIFKKCKIILDLDDAFFHRYDENKNSFYNFFLKKKFEYLFKNSSLVIVGSDYLKLEARKKGAKKIIKLPTGIEFSRAKKFQKIKKNQKFTVVWIGSPSTTVYLKEVIPALNKFFLSKKNIKFKIIGAKSFGFRDLPIEFHDWKLEEEYYLLSKCHVGIMPLFNDKWSKGKCAFKLLQYMAVGIPVIASPIGENLNVVKNNYNGYFARDTEEWLKYFEKLYNKRSLIKLMGKRGIKKIELNYDIEKLKSKLLHNLKQVAK